jgi:hypothetical protein
MQEPAYHLLLHRARLFGKVGGMSEQGYVTIRLGNGEREKLEKLAEKGMRSLSAEIRLAIRQHLEAKVKT